MHLADMYILSPPPPTHTHTPQTHINIDPPKSIHSKIHFMIMAETSTFGILNSRNVRGRNVLAKISMAETSVAEISFIQLLRVICKRCLGFSCAKWLVISLPNNRPCDMRPRKKQIQYRINQGSWARSRASPVFRMRLYLNRGPMTIFQDKLLTRTDCDEAGDYVVPNVLVQGTYSSDLT